MSDNLRRRRYSTLLRNPFIAAGSDYKHAGTEVQVSLSPLFEDDKIIATKLVSLPEDILYISMELELSLDDVVYSRYRYLFDSVSQPTGNPDQYTRDEWSRISSLYGDQEGFRYDSTVLTTPVVKIKENRTSILNEFLTATVDGFKVLVGVGKHSSTTWVVVDTDGNEIFSRKKDEDNLTSIRLPMSIFQHQKLYSIRAKFHTDTNAESNYGGVMYNPLILNASKIKLTPVLPFSVGQSLQYRVSIYASNAVSLHIKIYESVTDGEILRITKDVAPITNNIIIDSSQLVRGARYIVRAYAKVDDGSGAYSTPLEYIHDFVFQETNLYPNIPSSNYPGKYTLLNEIGQGNTCIVSRELKNGTFILGANGKTGFKIYAKYGDAIRTTGMEVELPTHITTANMEMPYINVLPMYNDHVMINYAIYSEGHYRSSVWALYNVNLVSNKFTLVTHKIFDDEHLATSLSSSAVVGKDNYVYYIPALFGEYGPNEEIPHLSSRFVSTNIDLTGRRWSPYILKQDEFGTGETTWGSSSKVEYSKSGDLIKFRTITKGYGNNELLSIDTTTFTGHASCSNGYSVSFKFMWPSAYTPGSPSFDQYPAIFSLTDGSGNNHAVSFALERDNSTGSTCKFNTQVSGGDGSNTIATTINKDEVVKVTVTVLPDRIKIFFNNVEVQSRTCNRAIDYVKKLYFGKAPNFQTGSEFYFGDVSFYNYPMDVDELSKIEEGNDVFNYRTLPMFKIGLVGSELVRTKLLDEVIPTATRHITMCSTGGGQEKGNETFLILGGTTNEKFVETLPTGQQVTGNFYYKLCNKKLYQYNTRTNAVTEIPNSDLPLNFPVTKYSLSAFHRGDDKIVVFNNSLYGPEYVNAASFTLDLTKIADGTHYEVDDNETIIDLPFRNTIVMRDGDFLRISSAPANISNVLLYPHIELTAYVDSDSVVNINKNLIVPIGTTMSIENAYRYESIVIEGDAPDNTGKLIWMDKNVRRVLDYRDIIITRNTTVTSAQDAATPKEHLWILDGVEYKIKG